MNLRVDREILGEKSTIGKLFVDGEYQCFTLELPKFFAGQENVPNKCCIPAGITYEVKMLPSPKHNGRLLPHVMNVPGRSNIEIHSANWPSELLGCMAVGELYDANTPDYIAHSDAAYYTLMEKLQPAFDRSETVDITYCE